jgi:hypothetical protein
LAPVVAEHRAIDAALDRDAVGADDRDEDEVAHAGRRRGRDQRAGLLAVALGRARAVHDDLGAADRGFDPLPRGEVPDRVAVAAAQDAHLVARRPQPRNEQAPERARAARHQDGLAHASPSFGHIGGIPPVY